MLQVESGLLVFSISMSLSETWSMIDRIFWMIVGSTDEAGAQSAAVKGPVWVSIRGVEHLKGQL